MALTDNLRDQALKLSGRAMEKLLADERRAMQLAKAVGAVQKGKQALDRAQDELLNQLGFASRGDYREIGRQMSSLKRRMRELAERIERM